MSKSRSYTGNTKAPRTSDESFGTIIVQTRIFVLSPLKKVYDGHDKVLHQRLMALRNEMRTRASTQSTELDAYLVTSYDEHMSDQLMESDERLKFLTGYSGTTGEAVITIKSAALWVDAAFYEQADHELNCDWRIFRSGEHPTIAEWISVSVHYFVIFKYND